MPPRGRYPRITANMHAPQNGSTYTTFGDWVARTERSGAGPTENTWKHRCVKAWPRLSGMKLKADLRWEAPSSWPACGPRWKQQLRRACTQASAHGRVGSK